MMLEIKHLEKILSETQNDNTTKDNPDAPDFTLYELSKIAQFIQQWGLCGAYLRSKMQILEREMHGYLVPEKELLGLIDCN